MYHNVFDYPLTVLELSKWCAGEASHVKTSASRFCEKDGLFFVCGREEIVAKRARRNAESVRKMEVAEKASDRIGKIPTILMVGVTGSLAMGNADGGSDIDLMIIVRPGTVWISRLLIFITLKLSGYEIRRAEQPERDNALCVNMIMDASDLCIDDQGRYTAHEIAQTVPMFVKKDVYARFIFANGWIEKYWPSAIVIPRAVDELELFGLLSRVIVPFETLAYVFQRWYMRHRLGREIVSRTRAFFHPKDWGSEVECRLCRNSRS